MNEFLNFDFCSVHVSMRCIRRQREKRAQKEELAVAGVAGWVCVSCHCFPYRRKYCYGFLTHSGDGGRAAAFLFLFLLCRKIAFLVDLGVSPFV